MKIKNICSVNKVSAIIASDSYAVVEVKHKKTDFTKQNLHFDGATQTLLIYC